MPKHATAAVLKPKSVEEEVPVLKKLPAKCVGGASVDKNGFLRITLEIHDDEVVVHGSFSQHTRDAVGVIFESDAECTIRFHNPNIFGADHEEITFIGESNPLNYCDEGFTAYSVYVGAGTIQTSIPSGFSPNYLLMMPKRVTPMSDPKIVVP